MSRATGIVVDIGRPDEVVPMEELEPVLAPIGLEDKTISTGPALAEKDVDDYQQKITHWLSK